MTEEEKIKKLIQSEFKFLQVIFLTLVTVCVVAGSIWGAIVFFVYANAVFAFWSYIAYQTAIANMEKDFEKTSKKG